MRLRQRIESWLPEIPREIVKGALRKAFYPDFGTTFAGQLTAYRVGNAEPAIWSADNRKPYGTLMNDYAFPHFLLARTMIRDCGIRSWCDLGTGSATLPLQAARLGIDDVLAVDGSDGALRQDKVRFPLSNYCVADVCLPLDIRTANGTPARFDVVTALELVEHLPDAKLPALLDNMIHLQPKFMVFAVGLQPEPPYHVNLKSMPEWLQTLASLLPGWEYDDPLSVRVFKKIRCHDRFRNEYPTNHLPQQRNLLLFRRVGRPS